MTARGARIRQAIPPEALAFGEDRSTWAYVPSGMPVYAVIGYLAGYDGDAEWLVQEAGGALTLDDIAFAKAYYQTHTDEIDAKLNQIENAQ